MPEILSGNLPLLVAGAVIALLIVPKSVWQPILSRLLGGKTGEAGSDHAGEDLDRLTCLIRCAREAGDESTAEALEALLIPVYRISERSHEH